MGERSGECFLEIRVGSRTLYSGPSRIKATRSFLFDVEAWLASTSIAGMTAEEERGYLRLILHSWKQPDCGLPDDDQLLAGLSLLGTKWKKSAARIRACFIRADNGRLYNERLLEEWGHQQRYHAERSQNASRAAKKRWSEQRVEETGGDASSMHQASAKQCLSHAIAKSEVRSNTLAAARELLSRGAPVSAPEPPPPPESELGQLAAALQACMPPNTPPPPEDLLRQIRASWADLGEILEYLRNFGRRRTPPRWYSFFVRVIPQDLAQPRRRPVAAPVVEMRMPAPACSECGDAGLVWPAGFDWDAERARGRTVDELCDMTRACPKCAKGATVGIPLAAHGGDQRGQCA